VFTQLPPSLDPAQAEKTIDAPFGADVEIRNVSHGEEYCSPEYSQ